MSSFFIIMCIISLILVFLYTNVKYLGLKNVWLIDDYFHKCLRIWGNPNKILRISVCGVSKTEEPDCLKENAFAKCVSLYNIVYSSSVISLVRLFNDFNLNVAIHMNIRVWCWHNNIMRTMKSELHIQLLLDITRDSCSDFVSWSIKLKLLIFHKAIH